MATRSKKNQPAQAKPVSRSAQATIVETIRKYLSDRNQVFTLLLVIIVIAGALAVSYFYTNKGDIKRDALTPEEKNLSEQLDQLNNQPEPTGEEAFQPTDETQPI